MILIFSFCINLNLLLQKIFAQEDEVEKNYCLF